MKYVRGGLLCVGIVCHSHYDDLENSIVSDEMVRVKHTFLTIIII